MRKLNLVVWILILVLISGCKNSENLTRRYKKSDGLQEYTADPKKYVDLNFISRPGTVKKTTEKPKTIFELSEKGQAALIEAHGSQANSNTDLSKALLEPLTKSTKKVSPLIDTSPLTITRQFSFFIDDKFRTNGGRIEQLELSIELDNQLINDGLIRFKGFQEFQTQYANVDFGTIESSTTRGFTLGSSLGITNSQSNSNTSDSESSETTISYTPSLSAELSRSYSESASRNLTTRRIAQTGYVSDSKIVVYMEGSPDRNLNGPINFIIQ